MAVSRLLRSTTMGLLILLAESDCSAGQHAGNEIKDKAAGHDVAETIGTASEEADGTLVLSLRAIGPDGMVGDAMKRYPPSDPHYDAVRQHVGRIPRGGSVPVRPFP